MPKGIYTHPLRPSGVREMCAVEAAWIGAMIEAEGWVTMSPPSSLHFAKVGFVNTEPELISAFLRATGVGSVSSWEPKAGALGRKRLYRWVLGGQEDIRSIARQCALYSLKLQKVEA